MQYEDIGCEGDEDLLSCTIENLQTVELAELSVEIETASFYLCTLVPHSEHHQSSPDQKDGSEEEYDLESIYVALETQIRVDYEQSGYNQKPYNVPTMIDSLCESQR